MATFYSDNTLQNNRMRRHLSYSRWVEKKNVFLPLPLAPGSSEAQSSCKFPGNDATCITMAHKSHNSIVVISQNIIIRLTRHVFYSRKHKIIANAFSSQRIPPENDPLNAKGYQSFFPPLTSILMHFRVIPSYI